MPKPPRRKARTTTSPLPDGAQAAFADFKQARSQARRDVLRWLRGGPQGDIRRLFLVKARIKTSEGMATLDGRFIDLANGAEEPEAWLRHKSPDDLLLDLEIVRWVLATNPPAFRQVLLRELNQAFAEPAREGRAHPGS